MASQEGVIKFKGAIGDLSFYKGKDGFMVRQSSGIDGNRIRNAPEFARTRENNQEFSHAGQAGKLLRKAFQSVLRNTADGRVASRLTKQMMVALKADATSDRGQRNVVDGELGFLQGFEFNNNSHLGSVLTAQYTTSIDRATGKMAANLPKFVPMNNVFAPPGATHFQFVVCGAEIDFNSGDIVVSVSQSADLAVSQKTATPVLLEATVTAGSTHPLFFVLGITFSQMVNGTAYPLQSGSYNALSMVTVDTPAKAAVPPHVAP
ncbi:MAG TPA: hypothetical protein VIU12_31550 [Chryseolinea sp.]